MVASAFLPVTIHNNKLHFLFAKEANDDSAPGFSDFGGGVEADENIYEAGLREFAEESTGCFGDESKIRVMVEKYGKVLPLVHNTYNIHIFRMDYDSSNVSFFNNTHSFIHSRLKDCDFLRSTKIFEKVEMSWMTVLDMIRRRDEFRPFYREIVDKLVSKDEIKRIKTFLRNSKLIRKTVSKISSKSYLRNTRKKK